MDILQGFGRQLPILPWNKVGIFSINADWTVRYCVWLKSNVKM